MSERPTEAERETAARTLDDDLETPGPHEPPPFSPGLGDDVHLVDVDDEPPPAAA